MAPVERTLQLKVKVSEAEKVMLQELADDAGLSVSDIVRQMIRAAHAERTPKKKR